MFRALLSRLGVRSGNGTDAEGDEGDEDGDGGGDDFLRSRLDASVLFAHGIRTRPEPEAGDVEDRARELEEEQRALEARQREFDARRRGE